MSYVQFQKSFLQTHDQNTKKFKFGQVVDLEKQAKQHSKIIVRQVRLEENQMIQVNNNKPIPYPIGFNIITKAQFDQLPVDQRNFFPWTAAQNKMVRVFFDRTQTGLERTISQQFVKPTAVYFNDVETGHRFMEFLKFRKEEPLQKRKANFVKVIKRWQYQVLLKFASQSVKKLEMLANKKRQQLKSEQDQCVKNCQELKTYDKNIFQTVFQTLYKLAQQEESKEKERIRQKKIEKLNSHEIMIKEIETRQLRVMVNYWKDSSYRKFQEQQESEQYEQEMLRIEEARIQAELEALEEQNKQEAEKTRQEQERQQLMQKQMQKIQHKDLHINQFKLIVGSHIRLLNPILYVQYKPLESQDQGKICFEKGDDVTFLQLDQKGWIADLHIILSHFQTSDILEFVIYDDYQDFNERILARAQEEETQKLAFLATAKKVLQGRILILELEKNLNNNRRHFARLDVSADLQWNASSNELLNVPMIQMDIYENTPFEITNSTINPFYLDIIELPLTAYELKYYIRQLKNPCNSLQQQWEEFKIKALEDALQARGQIWTNSKQSEDDLIEIQEYLSEEGFENKDGRYKQLYYYLYHNKIQNQQCFVRNKMIDACMKGFTKPARVELIPILLQFSEKIKKFADEYQLVWHENLGILEIVSQEVNKYVDEETLQQNRLKVQQYIESIQFKYNTIWTEQFKQKLQNWQQHIVKIVNGCGLIDNTQDKLLLIVRLFQLLDGRQDQDEIIYKIIRCLNYQLMVPKIQCDKLHLSWFKQHMSNLFSDFFYFDVWLRIFDYVMCIGFLDGSYDKVIASVVGGILQQINYQQYRTSEEFIVGLNIYGRLICDPEKLIIACFDSYNTNEFEYLEQEDEFKKTLTVNPYQQIYQDQLQFLQPKQISFIIDVPEEHEGSIYDVQDSQIMLPKAGQKFVYKQQIQQIYILIHNLFLHQISFCEQNSIIIQGQQKFEQDGFYFELPYTSNKIEIQVNENFKGTIDLRYFLTNTIYKNTLVLDDNYDMQRHYQVSEIEFSLLLKGGDVMYELQNTKDQAIIYMQDQCSLFGVQHNSFSHPDAFKIGNQLNYVEFKQLMIQYFKLDPSNINLQELYQKFLLDENQSVYLIDILQKLTSNKQQLNELINLFIPNEMIGHKHLRRLGLDNGDVKFLKVLISDDNYEQTVDLTDYFNQVLQNHYRKYNSYDLLLIDQNNRLYLLDNAGSFIQSFKTQMLILRIKYSSYGNIRKIQYQMNRSFRVAKDMPIQASSIKELLENNQRLLALDLNEEKKQPQQHNYFKHLVYLRCRDGAKQLETCSIIGKILNKNGEIQYYVVELDNKKKVIVYKEDVLLFDKIQFEELQTYQKVWKMQ